MNNATIKMWLGRLGALGKFLGALAGLTIAICQLFLQVIVAIGAWIADKWYDHSDAIFAMCMVGVVIAVFTVMITYMRWSNEAVATPVLAKAVAKSPCLKDPIAEWVDKYKKPITNEAFSILESRCEKEDLMNAHMKAVK